MHCIISKKYTTNVCGFLDLLLDLDPVTSTPDPIQWIKHISSTEKIAFFNNKNSFRNYDFKLM